MISRRSLFGLIAVLPFARQASATGEPLCSEMHFSKGADAETVERMRLLLGRHAEFVGSSVGMQIGLNPSIAEMTDDAAENAEWAFHSSGNGLGIQQPGSITSGGFFTATARSGRARDRARSAAC